MSDEMVTVPRELLKRVLSLAADHCALAQSHYLGNQELDLCQEAKQQRANIYDLWRFAQH